MSLPNCPKCNSEYVYEDGEMLVCPMCAYEWSATIGAAEEADNVVRDANGNELQDG
ncbi:MAG: alkylphosphonate utilization protein, partial [Selenomonadales bacterium]|nr:alkylphosphonate utilization protein [Selenomonadales bacterium]